MKKRQGFTLLELLIVVVILGVLALIAAPSLLNAADQAKEAAVKANVSAAASSVTSRLALDNADAASTIATNVVADLIETKNPINKDNPSFDDAASTTPGIVTLVADDGTDSIVITGYDKDGASLLTKTVRAPAAP